MGLDSLISKKMDSDLAKKVEPGKDDVSRETMIPISKIEPNRDQPRRQFDEAALVELAESIKLHGVIQPLIVCKREKTYEIIAGERRWRAAMKAGLKTVPVLIRDYSEQELYEVALIENLQRENLNAVEEARAYDLLMRKFGMTQEQLSERIGRSRSHIANFLRLLRLPERVQESLVQEVITMGQAKPLLTLEDQDHMQQAADYIVDHNLSARQAEIVVARLKKNPNLFQPTAKLDAPIKAERVFITDVEDRLKMLFGAPVRIALGQKKSKIEISFKTQEDLDRIVDAVQTLTKQHEDEVELTKKKLREVSWKFTT